MNQCALTRSLFLISTSALGVCAIDKHFKNARSKANAACDKIKFKGTFFRREIGFRVI